MGSELSSALKFRDGAREVFLIEVDDAEVEMGRSEVGIELEGLGEFRDGFGGIVLLNEERT